MCSLASASMQQRTFTGVTITTQGQMMVASDREEGSDTGSMTSSAMNRRHSAATCSRASGDSG